jgi:hypothetical protein
MAVQPTFAGFLAFVRNVMGIDTTILPDSSPVLPMAYAVAKAIVNPALMAICVPPVPDATPPTLGTTIYALAVYNLGGSNLINYAQDEPDAAIIPGSGEPGLPFFAFTRQKWNVNGFVSGVIQSAADESTSESMVVQEAAKNFTLANLQQLKDPYGRQYLAFAQSYGQSTWGLT